MVVMEKSISPPNTSTDLNTSYSMFPPNVSNVSETPSASDLKAEAREETTSHGIVHVSIEGKSDILFITSESEKKNCD